MFLREGIAKAVSEFISFLGLLWILWDKGRQGRHDKILSTHVVEIERGICRS